MNTCCTPGSTPPPKSTECFVIDRTAQHGAIDSDVVRSYHAHLIDAADALEPLKQQLQHHLEDLTAAINRATMQPPTAETQS